MPPLRAALARAGPLRTSMAEGDGHPILNLLAQRDPGLLDRLFADNFTCLTVFRSLPPLAKQYVLRLVLLDVPVHAEIIDAWPRPESEAVSQHRDTLQRLKRLKILADASRAAGSGKGEAAANGDSDVLDSAGYELNPRFRSSLRDALAGRVGGLRLGGDLGADKHRPEPRELDAFTDARWKSILYFMVGIRFGEAELPAELRELLIESGLLQSLEGGAYRITSKGFRFLFESQRVQVWTLISGYLDTLERRRMRVDEVLAFLFQLSFLEFGVEYPVAPLSDSQKVLVLDMAKLGLVWLRTPTSRRFYATRLALNLAAPPSELGAERAADGNIVTESSFKIYVYDPSAFQTALLNLFCRLTMRLPNLLAGSITKRSVRNALKNGIAAAQIVDYLEHYSHPRMRREPGRAAVPDNVSNQIRLWEEERQRMHFTKALLVSLPVQRQFNDAVSVLSRRKKLLLSVAERKHIVIEESGEPYLRQLLGLDAGSA